jgi:2-dehydropantoate 2-reductase
MKQEDSMSAYNERILIIGAGVNGSIVATGFQKAGLNVTLLARGKRFEEVRDQGVIIENAFSHQRTVTRVSVVDALRLEDEYDYILVIVRKNQVADLLPILANNRSANIVFMVNNPTGPEEWMRELGRERILLGFVFGAGKRENGIIYAMPDIGSKAGLFGKISATPFGEVDGSITPRLKRLVEIFGYAGFAARTTRAITDYLSTHAAMVALMAKLVMDRGYDRESLRRYTRDDFGLLVDAMREALDVLEAFGVRVTPKSNRVLKFIPKWVMVAIFAKLITTKFMEVGGLYHISQAPDEMRQLAAELSAMVEKTNLPAPAMRTLLEIQPVRG